MDQAEFFAAQQPTAEEIRRMRGNVAQARASSGFKSRVQALYNAAHDPAAAAASALRAKIIRAGAYWSDDSQTKARVYFNNVEVSARATVDGYYDLGANDWHVVNAGGIISNEAFGALVLKNIVKA